MECNFPIGVAMEPYKMYTIYDGWISSGILPEKNLATAYFEEAMAKFGGATSRKAP